MRHAQAFETGTPCLPPRRFGAIMSFAPAPQQDGGAAADAAAAAAAAQAAPAPRRRVHGRLGDAERRRALLVQDAAAAKRMLSGAKAKVKEEIRRERALLKKAGKYDQLTLGKICALKMDLPHVVCSHCECAVDTRKHLQKAILAVQAGRARHLNNPGLPLLAAAGSGGDVALSPPPPPPLEPDSVPPNELDEDDGDNASAAAEAGVADDMA